MRRRRHPGPRSRTRRLCRAWWSGATQKVSGPRPAWVGEGRDRTRASWRRRRPARRRRSTTAEAGRRGRAGRIRRPFSGGLTARGVPSAAAAGLCNGDLPSPSALGATCPAPHRATRRGAARLLVPAALPSAARRGRLPAPLRLRGKLPLLRRRLAGHSVARHSLVCAFGRWFVEQSRVSAGAACGVFCQSPAATSPLRYLFIKHPPPPIGSRNWGRNI